ncbi:hypothetical protein [Kribbella sp. NPDC006257]|uniref:hypothetical protein n=1 Tax=Kribbella sp. NPDC006257 TaxID=3156738 RepID=UPI0033A5449B
MSAEWSSCSPFQLVHAPPGPDHHPRQAALGVELVPQQRIAVGQEGPQPCSGLRVVDRQHLGWQMHTGSRFQLPPYDGRSKRPAINALAA